MQEKEHDYDAHRDHLFEERGAQRRDRTLDERGAIVGRDDLDARGQRTLKLAETLLHATDDVARVLAITRHDDRADGLALPIEIGESAPNLTADPHRADVRDRER